MAEALRRSVQSGIWLAVLAALAAGGCSKTVSNNSKAAGQEQPVADCNAAIAISGDTDAEAKELKAKAQSQIK